MEYKIGFVILHYNAYKETIQCAKSIMDKLDTDCYEIIIVDNDSPNKSLPIIQDELKDYKQIHFIQLNENIGFAKGNNEGINYARKTLNCDFVCCLNNDTEIIQNDFFKVILEEYNQSHFGLLGPKIVLNDGYNPTNENYHVNLDRFEKDLKELKLAYFLTKIYIGELIKKLRKSHPKNQKTDIDKRLENVMLHGCCLVFSPTFFEKLEGFYHDTFMFREEEFLFIRCQQNNLKTVYNPQLLIRHYEDSATNSIYKTSRTKSLFHLKNSIISTQKLITYMKENKV